MNPQNKSRKLYPHPFSKEYWKDAAAERKDLRMLVFAALMVALRIALKPVGIQLAPNLRINTAFFINALGAMTFGPVVAIIGAIISDTLGYLVFPNGVYFLPYILTEIGGSLIFALFLYRAKLTPTRVMLSRFCIDFFINIVLSAPITYFYYKLMLGKSYMMFQIPHMIKELFMFPIESVALTAFLALLCPVCYKLGLGYESGSSLKTFTKKQIALLVALLVIGTASVCGYLVYNYNTSNQVSWLETDEKIEMNAALTEEAVKEDKIAENQVLVVSKVNRKFGGDSVVEFIIYNTSADTDLEKVAAYRSSEANKDETLTKAATGSVTLVKNSLTDLTGMTVKNAN